MNNIIKIELPEGTEAEWKEIGGKIVLVEEKKADNRPVIERIKTFEDACNELGRMAEKGDDTAANLLSDYESNGNNILVKQTLATMKLSIIAHALNEGWQPQFTKGEYRYHPWFYLYTQEQIDRMDKEEKKKLWLFSSNSDNGAMYGLASVRSGGGWVNSVADFSALLAVKTAELSYYFGQQFIEIWADYVGPFNCKQAGKLPAN